MTKITDISHHTMVQYKDTCANQTQVRKLKNGDLLAVFNQERYPFHHDTGQTVMTRSKDGGITWSEPTVVVPWSQTTGSWDCGICELNDGTLIINFNICGFFKRGMKPNQPSWANQPITNEWGDWTWTFKTLGHENVSILNGGFKSWKDAGYKVVAGENSLSPKVFKASINKKYSASYKEVRNAKKETNGICLIDARPNDFFKGVKKHPALKVAGRIPNAVNVEQQKTVGSDGFIKSKAEILKLYDAAQIKDFKGYITYCNTGHWAATVWFALSEVANIPQVRMYDGSWAHWESNPKNKVISG